VLSKDVEDGGGQVGVLAVLDELTQDTESHVFAFGQLGGNDEFEYKT
jgi:hypothetical protein